MAHTRLFRFYLTFDLRAVPEPVKDRFSPDVMDYFFGYTVLDADMLGGRWERVPVDGIMDFPLSTNKKSGFLVGVTVLPNSKVDPDAPESRPLQRSSGTDTNDFSPIKARDVPDLAKKFPDGVFILQIDLVALYVPLLVPGLATFDVELAQAGIRPEDIIYHGMDPVWDDAGKAASTQHHVVWWSDDLRLSGRQYVR